MTNQQTAYEWHGGQWSPLYSFASTGGVVHTESHREQLLDEIGDCIEHCKQDNAHDHHERERLHKLAAFVKSFEIEKEN